MATAAAPATSAAAVMMCVRIDLAGLLTCGGRLSAGPPVALKGRPYTCWSSQNLYDNASWKARGGWRLNGCRTPGLYSWFAPVFHCVFAPVLNTLNTFSAGSTDWRPNVKRRPTFSCRYFAVSLITWPSLRVGLSRHGSVVLPQNRIVVASGFGCVVPLASVTVAGPNRGSAAAMRVTSGPT